MNTLPQIKVYFNNGASVTQPWHVAGTEGNAMATDHGQFSNAETAIIHAAELARISSKPLIVPAWLQAMADEIAFMNGVLDSMRQGVTPVECQLADQWLYGQPTNSGENGMEYDELEAYDG